MSGISFGDKGQLRMGMTITEKILAAHADKEQVLPGDMIMARVDALPEGAKEVLQALPMEFALEAQQLVAISLEGSVG